MPTRVFGKSLELYAGSEINKTRLIFELEQLGYVRSQQLTKSGQFTVSANQIVFFRIGIKRNILVRSLPKSQCYFLACG